jgi:hypothetical protein
LEFQHPVHEVCLTVMEGWRTKLGAGSVDCGGEEEESEREGVNESLFICFLIFQASDCRGMSLRGILPDLCVAERGFARKGAVRSSRRT